MPKAEPAVRQPRSPGTRQRLRALEAGKGKKSVMGTTAKAVSFDGESLNFTKLGPKPAHTPSGPSQEVGCADPGIRTANCQRRPRAWAWGSEACLHLAGRAWFPFSNLTPRRPKTLSTPASSGAKALQHRRERDPCPTARSWRANPTNRDPRGAERHACVERPEANPASEASCPDVGLASGNCSGRAVVRARDPGLRGRQWEGPQGPTREPGSQRAGFVRKGEPLWGGKM